MNPGHPKQASDADPWVRRATNPRNVAARRPHGPTHGGTKGIGPWGVVRTGLWKGLWRAVARSRQVAGRAAGTARVGRWSVAAAPSEP